MSLDVDLEVARSRFRVQVVFGSAAGETLVLLGPNGSGKTTVLSCLAGTTTPDRGRIVLGGEVLLDTSASIDVAPQARSVGMLFQDGLLFPHLSAVDNAAFPLRARGIDKEAARTRARKLMERLGLPSDRAAARPSALSGGEGQRVGLARALIAEPALLLLDEPTSALDIQSKSLLRPVISDTLRSFPGVRVIVTHDPVDAMTLADRLIVLEEGRITQSGTPDDLRRAPRSAYIAELVGQNMIRGTLVSLPDGVSRIESADGSVIAGATDIPAGSNVIGVVPPSDIELHMEPPPAGSAWNVIDGTVASIAVDGDRATVRLDGRPALTVQITLGSLRRLGLQEGTPAWASFKALAVRVEPWFGAS